MFKTKEHTQSEQRDSLCKTAKMGECEESACLRRSFSHPSSGAPREFMQVDPVRALMESISFGRFVSDSLDWGKWSSFSSNRYLEEAENFSKPGSVARKKAFFEAHYNKKAATQASSQVLEGLAAPSDSEAWEASMQLDAIKQVDNDAPLEEERTCVSSVEISFPSDGLVPVPNTAIDESKSTVVLPDSVEGKDNLQPHGAPLFTDEHVSEKEVLLEETINPRLETVDGPISDSQEEKEVKSPASASTPIQTLTSKVAKSMASYQARSADNAAGSGRKSASKRIKEKSTGPRSLHVSINLASASGLSQSWKARGPKFSTIFEKERSSSTSTQNQLQAATPKHSLCAPSSNVKRIVSILNKSMTGPMRMTTDKESNLLRPLYARCSTIAETRAKPNTMCAPFGLRSAERAQKRKEFFLKQQDRIGAEEAEKRHPAQRSQARIARPPSPESGKDVTSTNPGSSKSRRRAAAQSSSLGRNHVEENTSPNIQA